jgi:nucleotide-binding universal stress UspA family protein
MKKCIVVGIDTPLSPATQQAIRTIKEIIGPIMVPDLRLILLHVIPFPYLVSTTLGTCTPQLQLPGITQEQRQAAEKVLATVQEDLREQTFSALRIDTCIRLGSPVEEIVRVAGELRADIVIVGSRGNRGWERIRRFFLGSKSRKILQSATCPVMIVSLAYAKPPADLVDWYGKAITHYLAENPGGLTVFSSTEVTQLFAPPDLNKKLGRKERAAAILALEQLAGRGVLCRHDIQGKMLYVND